MTGYGPVTRYGCDMSRIVSADLSLGLTSRSRQLTTSVAAVVAAVALFADLTIGGLRAAEITISGLVALIAILAASTWPGAAIGCALAFVPLQIALMAFLYKHGAPAGLVRDAGYIKDAAVGGVCLAAVTRRGHSTRSPRPRTDMLDRLAIAYLGIATAYLVLPIVFPDVLGGQTFSVRINAWRLDCLFVVLMLAARRVALPPQTLWRLRGVVIIVAALMCAVGVWESVSNTGYNNFIVHTLGVPFYQADILHVSPPPGYDYIVHGTVGGASLVRVGSLLVDEIVLGFYMVLPLALGIERISESRPRLIAVLGIVAGGVTLVLSETRSAILSGGVAILLSVWLGFRRRSTSRFRTTVLLVAAAVLIVPLTAHSTVRQRFDSLIGNSHDTDNQNHISASRAGLNEVLHHPEGRGLGANPATGLRNQTTNVVVTENSYLQVGTELGAVAMLLFIGMYIALLARLRRIARRDDESGRLAAACWLAGSGLFVGGFFLQIWPAFAVSLTFWGLAGIATAKHLATTEEPSTRTGVLAAQTAGMTF